MIGGGWKEKKPNKMMKSEWRILRILNSQPLSRCKISAAILVIAGCLITIRFVMLLPMCKKCGSYLIPIYNNKLIILCVVRRLFSFNPVGSLSI